MTTTYKADPKLDLVLERVVDVPKELVWRAWTEPALMEKWFTPAPWTTSNCEVDLRPGGLFRTVMTSPEGENFPNSGCYLEIIPNEKLVWTSARGENFRPATTPEGSFPFTAMILLESHGTGTKYTAIAIHGDEATREQHGAMGFQEGWGAALDQLVAMAKSM
jgi:uncharacterized protein YndB with AHSA1/START domain